MRAFLLILFAAVVVASAIPAVRKTNIRVTGEPDCLGTDINLVYTASTKALLINWVMPTACPDAVSFSVDLSINGKVENIPQVAPGFPMAQKVLDNDPSCEKITVEVITLDADGTTLATSDPVQLPIKLPAVENPTFSQDDSGIHIKWSPLDLGANCAVKYTVFVDGVKDGDYNAPEFEIAPSDIHMCTTVTVAIQATSNDFLSEKTEVVVDAKMPAVSVLEVKHTDDGVEVDFDPIPDEGIDDACGTVSYKVVEREEACFRSNYGVMAVSQIDKLLGLEASKTVARKPTTVNNLRADVRGQEIVVNWVPPSGGEKCNLEYSGKYGEHVLDKPIHATTLTIPYATAACAVDKIEVWAITNGLVGDISTVDIVGELGTVLNLVCAAGNTANGKTTVTCEWTEPAGCDDDETTMLYEVKFYNGVEVKTESVSVKEFEFDTSACGDTWVIVTPLLSDVSGDMVEVEVQNCPAK